MTALIPSHLQGSGIILTSEDFVGSDEDSNEAVEPDIPAEFGVHWEAAMENPHNFHGWTKLLEYIDKENNLVASRRVFEAFLMRFPYCYGYWKQYADLEDRFKNPAGVEEVYSRGLQSIPLSVDLWIHYITYLNNTLDITLPESIEKLRETFKAAVNAAGMEFRSDKLWDMYIRWERDQKNYRAATGVYDHVLNIPTQLYRQHFDSFKELISSVPINEILSPEEFQWIRSNLTKEGEDCQTAAEEDSPSGDDQAAVDSVTDTELQEKIKQQALLIREQLFLLNEAEVRKRWTFEEAITRPYFHATPLDRAQLQNWRSYLEFEIADGRYERIVALFERCLVACALYEEFWLSYTRYMETHSVDTTRTIFQRACQIHMPQKPTINLQWAAFEEKHGQLDTARAILCDLETMVPGLAMVRLRRVSLERRSGNLDEAERLLRESVQSSLGTNMAAFYAIKLARFLLKLRGNSESARELLIQALEREPDNPRLHLCLLEFEVSRDATQGENDAISCVDRALRSSVQDDIKKIMSQRRLEYLEDRGSNIASWVSAYDEHQKLMEQQKELKKQAAKNNKVPEEPEDKRPKIESAPVPTQIPVRSPLLPNPTYPPIAPPVGMRQPAPVPPYGVQPENSFRPNAPPYGYDPWYQNYRGYNCAPTPWNVNRYFMGH
ncbi:pre-mRNA-processing factor 39-like [Pelodytes ibericus]